MTDHKPTIRKRNQHTVSRNDIDPDALKVLYRLRNHGHLAYLVGGGVRDLLLGEQPKDFDISTDAHPRRIKKLFRNCFLIGRRFRLAHIRFGKKVIETSTFRSEPVPIDPSQPKNELLVRHDNTFGTPEQDARRRDFTINALFYDIRTFSVIDHVGGLPDLDHRMIRSIGDPEVRFHEDPVRMVRAVRFASRLGFKIERETYQAILTHHEAIQKAAPPRMYEEILKLFAYGAGEKAFRLLHQTQLLADLFPEINDWIDEVDSRRARDYWKLLKALDKRTVRDDVRPAPVLFAALLYVPYRNAIREDNITRFNDAMDRAKTLIEPVARRFNMPKRTLHDAVAYLASQHRLESSRRRFSKARFMGQPAFLPSLALLEMGVEIGMVKPDALEYWQAAYREENGRDPDTRLTPPEKAPPGSRRRRPRNRRPADDRPPRQRRRRR